MLILVNFYKRKKLKSLFYFSYNFIHRGYIKKYVFYIKLYLSGLGYKIFLYKNTLFFLLGFSHYILISVPDYIKIYSFKKRFYVFAKTLVAFNNFLCLISQLRYLNVYKSKGVFFAKQQKLILRMKAGKKQQFM